MGGELSPHSDIDLMFLYSRVQWGNSFDLLKENHDQGNPLSLVGYCMKVGHASREVKEALVEAQKIYGTKFDVDARYICGDRKIAKKFITKFLKTLPKEKPENTSVNPFPSAGKKAGKGKHSFPAGSDLKNGVGGPRDYQGVLWMTKANLKTIPYPSLIRRGYLNENEAKSYQEAYSFLFKIRNELHFRSKRPVDILHLEKQPEVALGLGYNDEDIFPRVENSWRFLRQSEYTIHQLFSYLNSVSFGQPVDPLPLLVSGPYSVLTVHHQWKKWMGLICRTEN